MHAHYLNFRFRCIAVTTPPTPVGLTTPTTIATSPTPRQTPNPTAIPPTPMPTAQPTPIPPTPLPIPPAGSPCSVYAQCQLCVDKSKHPERDCKFCATQCQDPTATCSATPLINMGQACPTPAPTPQPTLRPSPAPSPAPTGLPCPMYKDCANCGEYAVTKPSSCHWCYNPADVTDGTCIPSDRLCSVPQTEAVVQGAACPVVTTTTTTLNEQPTPPTPTGGTPSPSDPLTTISPNG